MESGRGIYRDRLSGLPDSIILHILSLLSIRDLISTTFLSRRWKNLWSTVPCLNFSFSDVYQYNEDHEDEKVRNFVNRALLFWKGSKILKFNLDIHFNYGHTTLAGDIDLWVRFAVDNNVEQLILDLISTCGENEWEDLFRGVYTVPQYLYSCTSITELSLVGCNVKIHGSPTWNRLKILKIDGFSFSEDLINRIMLGCPLLEDFDLVLQETNEDLSIQSTSLKKLKIEKYVCDGQLSLHTKMTIRCPNLKILELLGFMYSNYRLESVSSLKVAALRFENPYACVRKHEYMLTKVRGLFSALKHVDSVALSESCVEVLSGSENPLPNVKFLNLCVRVVELERLVNLLANFPNVKMLVIKVELAQQECTFIDKPLEPGECLSTYSFPQLSTIDIHAHIDNPKIFQFIVSLLNHYSMLQKLVICAYDVKRYPPEFMFKVAGVMVSLQRSYPTTQMILNKLT